MDKFKLNSEDPFVKDILNVLLAYGKIKEITEAVIPRLAPSPGIGDIEPPVQPPVRKVGTIGYEQYLTTGLPIENVFERICRQFFGFCQDKKDWKKELQAAVKDVGHDELIKAFYEWSETQVGSHRKPISTFLRNANSHVVATSGVKPQVTNHNLDYVEKEISYASDNKVIFTGDYKFKLAVLVKEYGVQLVVNAFKEFYENMDDKQLPWASREFLLRAPVMIATIIRRLEEAKKQERMIADEYKAASESVEEITDEVEL